MTRFHRAGHYRTSKYGIQYWVSDHVVDRMEWGRHGIYGGPSNFLLTARTACFVNPNAHCPVCGADVFYYQNEWGSRVFFDELGPPWPKHPCTESMDPRRLRKKKSKAESPLLLETDEGFGCADRATIDRLTEIFQRQHRTVPWDAYRVMKVFRAEPLNLIVAEGVSAGRSRPLFIRMETSRTKWKPGDFFFRKKGKISFIAHGHIKPQSMAVKVIRSATEFVQLIPSR
jgi:hypothetical protein